MKRSWMQRLIESGFYAGILTASGFGFYYFIGLLLTLAQGGDTTKFFTDSIVGGFFAFLFFWFVCWEISGMFERANQRGRRDGRSEEDNTDQSDHDKTS